MKNILDFFKGCNSSNRIICSRLLLFIFIMLNLIILNYLLFNYGYCKSTYILSLLLVEVVIIDLIFMLTVDIRQFDFKKNRSIILGCIISSLFLTMFIIMNMMNKDALDLDSQWLVISCIPIFLSLIVGGYIKSFKGFGVELETTLKSPLMNLDLMVSDAISRVQVGKKDSLEKLRVLTPEQRAKYECLSFIYGKKDYYDSYAIEKYMEVLWAIKYFEIREENGEFICLIARSNIVRKNEFRKTEEIDLMMINSFIKNLEDRTLLREYKESCITQTVNYSDSLLTVLRILRKRNLEICAVLSEERQFMGIVKTQDIEHIIVNKVLNVKSEVPL